MILKRRISNWANAHDDKLLGQALYAIEWSTQLRDRLRGIPAERRARTYAQLACPSGADRLTRAVYQTLIRLGEHAIKRYLARHLNRTLNRLNTT